MFHLLPTEMFGERTEKYGSDTIVRVERKITLQTVKIVQQITRKKRLNFGLIHCKGDGNS
jgi:hypothetical protein